MRRSRTTATAAACAVLLVSTAACSGSDDTPQATGPVTVTVMTWESAETNAAIDKALAGFKDPNITVKRIDTPSGGYGDKLASLTQAKKLPDLFWCGNDTEQQYTGQGLLVDWAPRLSEGSDFTADKFVPSSIENWKTADGRMGGLPSLMNTYGIWYNADAFTAAGVPLPKDGWTWDEMFDAATKLTKKNGATYGLVADGMTGKDGPFTMSTYALSKNAEPFTDSVNHPTKAAASEAYTEGVQKLAAGVQSGSIAPPGYDITNVQSLFAAGKIPMMLGGQWLAAGYLTDKPKIKYGFAPLPQADKAATLYDSVGVCTPSYTANQDSTYKVLQYLNTDVWSKVLPASPVAPPAYVPAQATYFTALGKTGVPSVAATVQTGLKTEALAGVRFTTPWATQALAVVTAYWGPILTGKKDIGELNTMVDKTNDLIKAAG